MSDDTTPTDAPATTPTVTPASNPEEFVSMKLGDKFDGALIGADISGRFAYSLVMLTEMAMELFKFDAETAKQYVAHQVYQIQVAHGTSAPVFIDDELVRGAPRVRGVIATPAGHDVPKDILVPGQNHGAVKGFIAPQELGR